LLHGAGFTHVEVTPATLISHFPQPEQFLAGEIDLDTAAIPSMQHLDAQARQEIVAAIAAEMAGPLRDATEGGQVVLPFHALIASAR
jgi:hypothetical protein